MSEDKPKKLLDVALVDRVPERKPMIPPMSPIMKETLGYIRQLSPGKIMIIKNFSDNQKNANNFGQRIRTTTKRKGIDVKVSVRENIIYIRRES